MPYYPGEFYVVRSGLRWLVVSRYQDGIERSEIGPYWRRITALRFVATLTQHYRTGFDQGILHATMTDTASQGEK